MGRSGKKGKGRRNHLRLQGANGHFQDTSWLDGDAVSEKGSDPVVQAAATPNKEGSLIPLADEKVIIDDLVNQMASYHTSLEDALASDKPFRYIMAGNGIYRIEVNEIGTFLTKSDSIPGLKNVRPGFSLSLPGKAPYSFFLQILSFFRDVCEQKNQAEAMVQLFWNRTTQEYFVYKPIQIVSKASVHFKRNVELEGAHLLVADIHSHNTMGAYFSQVDDRDEKQQTRLYGVLGKVTSKTPEWKFRVSCGGTFHEIDIFDIFDNPFEDVTYPQEWLDNLILESNTVTTPGIASAQIYVPYPGTSQPQATRLTTSGASATHGPVGIDPYKPVGIRSTAGPMYPQEGADHTYSPGHTPSGGTGSSFWGDAIDVERLLGGYVDTSDHLATVSNPSSDPDMTDDSHVIEITEELLEYGYGPLIKEMLNDWGDSNRFYFEYYEKTYKSTSMTYPVKKVITMVERLLHAGNSVTVAAAISGWEKAKVTPPVS